MSNLDAVLADAAEGTAGKAGRIWLGPLTKDEFLASITRAVWTDNGLLVEVNTPEGIAVWSFKAGF